MGEKVAQVSGVTGVSCSSDAVWVEHVGSDMAAKGLVMYYDKWRRMHVFAG